MPEISVIVPVYNVETKLERCLESLKNQTFREFEVILVDDGSKDGSGAICDRYADEDGSFRAYHLSNGGVSKARNYGLAKAKGEYIAFVDSDDYVEPDYLKILRMNISDDTDLCICGVNFCSESSQIKRSQKPYEDFDFKLNLASSPIIAELLRERRFNYVYGKLYKKSIIEKNSIIFYEDMVLGEDTVFVLDYLKYIRKGRIIGKAYYNYVKYQAGTLTNKSYSDLYEKYTFISDYIWTTFNDLGVLDEKIKNVISERRIESARWAIAIFRKEKNLGKKEKAKRIEKVLKSRALQQALEEDCDNFDVAYSEISLMRKGDAKKLLNYYERTERRERNKERMKRIIRKIVPKSLIVRLKKWRLSVR